MDWDQREQHWPGPGWNVRAVNSRETATSPGSHPAAEPRCGSLKKPQAGVRPHFLVGCHGAANTLPPRPPPPRTRSPARAGSERDPRPLPRRLAGAGRLRLPLTTRSVVDNFGSSLGLFSDISSLVPDRDASRNGAGKRLPASDWPNNLETIRAKEPR